MRRPSVISIVRLFAALSAVVLAAPGVRAHAASGPSISALRASGAKEVRGLFVRQPTVVAPDQPLQVLVALHGMAGNGTDFGNALVAQADARGWLVVAPTFSYGDWTDPNQIAREEPALVEWLSDFVTHLSERTGYSVQPRVLLFGHSRGAQLALRFTEVHPDQVAGVAAASAGTYTLPVEADFNTGAALPFPFGIADLTQRDGGQVFDLADFTAVPIWIGVGGSDTVDGDVPDAWDPYIGVDRLARAQRFTQIMQALGGNVSLDVFPHTDHTLTDEMRAAGCSALAASTSPG